jgi:hypothetical protein
VTSIFSAHRVSRAAFAEFRGRFGLLCVEGTGLSPLLKRQSLYINKNKIINNISKESSFLKTKAVTTANDGLASSNFSKGCSMPTKKTNTS